MIKIDPKETLKSEIRSNNIGQRNCWILISVSVALIAGAIFATVFFFHLLPFPLSILALCFWTGGNGLVIYEAKQELSRLKALQRTFKDTLKILEDIPALEENLDLKSLPAKLIAERVKEWLNNQQKNPAEIEMTVISNEAPPEDSSKPNRASIHLHNLEDINPNLVQIEDL